MATPPFSVDDLVTPLTADEVTTSIYAVLAKVGVRTSVWKPGGVVRTMIAAVAIIVASLSSLIASVTKSGFIGLATGNWLRIAAFYERNVTAQLATFAAGPLTLTNSKGGVYTIDVGDFTASSSATKQTYTNTAAFTLAAFSSISVPMQATASGSASSAAPGAIDTLVTPLNGVTCANSVAFVGLDDEDDAALTIRCNDKLGSLSPNGPSDAYGFAARTAVTQDGTPCGISRVKAIPDGFGNVTVYVASASGAVSGAVGDTTTVLGAVDNAIQTQVAPLTINAVTLSATNKLVAVSYELWTFNTSSLSSATINTLVAASLATFMAAQPIGGVITDGVLGAVYVSALEAAISTATAQDGSRLQVIRVIVSLPAGDLTLNVGEVPVLGAVVPVAIHQVPLTGAI